MMLDIGCCTPGTPSFCGAGCWTNGEASVMNRDITNSAHRVLFIFLSRDDVVKDFACRVCQAEVASAVLISELRVVDTQQVEHRRVQIMHVSSLLDSLVSELIGGPVCHSALNATAGEPHREAARI